MSSQTGSAFMLGQFVGAALMIALPVVIGVWYANRVNRAKDQDDQVRWPIVVGFAVSLLFLVGQCSNSASQANEPVELVVQSGNGAASEPFPRAAEFSREDLDAYSQFIVDSLKSNPGHSQLNYSGLSIAIDGEARTIVRNSLFLDSVLINRQYVASIDGHLATVNCFNPGDLPLDQEDLNQCRSEALRRLGGFSEEGGDNG